ncbi:Polyketide synthase PksJ [Balamuthia mandrillaris]
MVKAAYQKGVPCHVSLSIPLFVFCMWESYQPLENWVMDSTVAQGSAASTVLPPENFIDILCRQPSFCKHLSQGPKRGRPPTTPSQPFSRAGPSGLTVAKSLLEEGLNVLVLEQTDQIGGNWVYREAGEPFNDVIKA